MNLYTFILTYNYVTQWVNILISKVLKYYIFNNKF